MIAWRSLCKLELKALHIGPTLHTTWIIPITLSNNLSPSKLDLPFPYILYMWNNKICIQNYLCVSKDPKFNA
jgi:hypothetical protein